MVILIIIVNKKELIFRGKAYTILFKTAKVNPSETSSLYDMLHQMYFLYIHI